MNKKFNDELIVAFLDGEVTAEEKAFVEQQLVDSADHRRTFDELKALRTSLQSLPKHELDDEFAARILRRAERAMLVGQKSPASTEPEVHSSLKAAHNDRGNWLVAVTVVSSVAAALLISLFVLPPQQNNSSNSVARNTSGPQQSATVDKPADEKSVRKLASVMEGESGHDDNIAGFAGVGDKSDDLHPGAISEEMAKKKAPNLNFSAEQFDKAAPVTDQLDQAPGSELFNQSSDMKSRLGSRQVEPTDGAKGANSPGESAGGIAHSVVEVNTADSQLVDGIDLRTSTGDLNARFSSDDRFVALLDVPREAFEQGAFDQALLANGIKIVSEQSKYAKNDGRADSPAADGDDASVSPPSPASNEPVANKKSEKAKDHENRQDVDVVFVEATMEQIESTLLKLERDGYLLAQTVYREPSAVRIANNRFEFDRDGPVGRSELQRSNRRAVQESEERSRAIDNNSRTDDDTTALKVKAEAAGADAKSAAPIGGAPRKPDSPKSDAKPSEQKQANADFGTPPTNPPVPADSPATDMPLSDGAGPANQGIAVRVPKPQAPMRELLKAVGQNQSAGKSAPEPQPESLAGPRGLAQPESKNEGTQQRDNRIQDAKVGDALGAGAGNADAFNNAARQPRTPNDKVRVVLVIRALPSTPSILIEQAPPAEAADRAGPADK